MDLSRESQTPTNTSKVEESFNCSFLLSIRYYYFAFIISFLQLLHYLNFGKKNPCHCKSACSTRRKQGSTRGCPCRGDDRLCTEASLRLLLFFGGSRSDDRKCVCCSHCSQATKQAAMTRSLNRLRRFQKIPSARTFRQIEKMRFSKYV